MTDIEDKNVPFEENVEEQQDESLEGITQVLTDVSDRKMERISVPQYIYQLNEYRLYQNQVRGQIHNEFAQEVSIYVDKINRFNRLMRDAQILGAYEGVVFWQGKKDGTFGYQRGTKKIGFNSDDTPKLKKNQEQIDELDFIMICMRQIDQYQDLLTQAQKNYTAKMQASMGLEEQFNHLERQVSTDFKKSPVKITCYSDKESGEVSYSIQYKNPIKRLYSKIIHTLADRLNKNETTSSTDLERPLEL